MPWLANHTPDLILFITNHKKAGGVPFDFALPAERSTPKIAVSHFGNDPPIHHSRKDLHYAHAILDLHRMLGLVWSYVEHRKSRRGRQFRKGNRHSCLP